MRLCKDCIHIVEYAMLPPKCNYTREPVFGAPKNTCSENRAGVGCGYTANWFEQKPKKVSTIKLFIYWLSTHIGFKL